ncbi:MAG: hypothetical protein KDD64_01715 [Bdellovibrionales bacterium]|nr:hypothetical protein [Bdellovibrionales bacterium]
MKVALAIIFILYATALWHMVFTRQIRGAQLLIWSIVALLPVVGPLAYFGLFQTPQPHSDATMAKSDYEMTHSDYWFRWAPWPRTKKGSTSDEELRELEMRAGWSLLLFALLLIFGSTIMTFIWNWVRKLL